ncbi:tubulin epsilon and delta complex protein 1 isoform X2 [Pseudophryne corroboree]|uniref:tubulin epsilon and delta complex protein 1 isoform X2 n=1 Tax=Pseudophryne corroboree TaxID=495146 RepID=UPI003081DD74
MQRAGSAREVLCALCRALSASGHFWDPEVFRKSKFNRPEATPEFWKLLYNLLKQIYPSEEDLSPSAPEKNAIANQVQYVKCVLQTQGYGRPAFYALPNGGEEGSRELLLAFSWLLCRVKILEIMLEKNRVKVGDHVTICTCTYDKAFKNVKDTLPATKRNLDIRYIQWLNGKLQLCRRTLYTGHLEECAILYKIHSYTQGCHIDRTTSHLSVMETELIRQPESCNKETVLQSASEDEQSLTTHNINKCTFYSSGYRPRKSLSDIQVLGMRLRGLNEQLHELTSNRKLLWHEQSKDLERDLSQKELYLTIKKIKQEVKKKLEHLKHQSAQSEDIHGSFRIIFRESKLQKTAAHKEHNVRDLQATEVITFLQGAITNMEAEYEKLQDQCRTRLDEITERLEGVICIPPTKC